MRTLARWLVDERGHHRPVSDPAAADTYAIRGYREVGLAAVGTVRASWHNHRTGAWEKGLLLELPAAELT
ncbi:hypothetical protein Sgou_17210 [Streptomyces gougerotii]|uniref:Uncharacterized protein n=3 Tax=Streptomyces TaxID=1883 RepID=A0A8H9HLR0_9ACTN|nr:hypothetical protein EES47_21110 [Streptomyces sp. ADI98-12]SUO94810.1 Kanamycin acetyltransferase [Streptomyces griseus]GFH63578.1 hypothetical protein Srut_00920 [Streptomyces rutgersensis]GFH74743.1 hypothetical protein Sdia_55110 [Streptomyces diastaticus subsp. diastaticus]GFH77051.1 hypothetical protein Sgou_17210 [Streptomyces gougerotii]